MKKKPIIFIVFILIIFTYGYEKNKENVTSIEQLTYTDRENLLLKSEGVDHSYIFKINNLEPSSTYQFECWSEYYKNGQLDNKLEILEQPQTFVIGQKSSDGYILLNIQEHSNALNCILSGDNHNNFIIISGYKNESFKFKGVITALKEMKISQNNEILLLASANGKNASFGIPINQQKKLIQDDIKKNDEVYLIKCKLTKIH
ncbi:hypothetical protein [Tepidibacter aestuarii]|uniref:hypothetical protein n=1 Tax=Tepidibacter aestuarii TaxID=2925782 RepID=UPI0020BF032C|nr:hypothetical protein [Tepidibacter aestuarii]CAH2214828.1 protein of unknown function [Tepidibacter aestuarii]